MSGKHKLYQYLETLSLREWKRFEAYVVSEQGTPHVETRTLFLALAKCHPDFSLDDEELFRLAFPHRPYKNARLRILRNYLLDVLRNFLVMEELRLRPQIHQDLLILALQRRQLSHDANKIAEKTIQEIRSVPVVDLEIAQRAFFLEERSLDFQLKDHTAPTVDYSPVLQSLDVFTTASRMKFLCGAISAGRVPRSELPDKETEITLEYVRELDLVQAPVVAIYYHLLHLLHPRYADADHWGLLQALLYEFHLQIVPADVQNILGLLANKYISDLRRGIPGSLLMAFNCFHGLYELNLLFGFGAFTIQAVRNLISLGIRLKRFEWIRQFLEETRQKLPAQFAENIYHFGSAGLEFEQSEFVKAKRHLLQVKFYDATYKLSNDILLIRIYFELGESEPFHSLRASVVRFLNRQSLFPEHYKTSRKNFCRILGDLFEASYNPNSRQTAPKIRDKVDKMDGLILREWIEDKLDQLEKVKT